MQEYRKAKGLKDPVQFNDSMIVLTPQKDGDSSDPRMPLNFAHGEPIPQPESHTQSAPVNVAVSTEDMHTGTILLPPTLTIESGFVPAEFPLAIENTASAWASSSESFSPWVQYGESDPDGDNYPRLQPTYPQSYAASATTESLSTSQYDVRPGMAEIDAQMLEIDWVSDISLFPVALLRTSANFMTRTSGIVSSPLKLMMATWMFQTIICGSHMALTNPLFNLTSSANTIYTLMRNSCIFFLR
jgi:hypothetical protein